MEPANRAAALALPVILLVALGAALIIADPAERFGNGAPPPEEITFERVELREDGIVVRARNAVSAEVTIAQVMVDDAFWDFTAEPTATLGAFDTTTITIPYPWVAGEPHAIGLITNTGLVWTHDIEVATLTPTVGPASLSNYALIGLLVGFLPVAAGMAFFPAMRNAPVRWTNAILALTLGLLTFLAIDTIGEGLELADAVPGGFQGLGLFFGSAIVALVGVLALGKAMRGSAVGLALMIAIGIGLHNLGEGLLIGSAFGIGSLALGTTLILGFAIHNVTEGPAIVAPLASAYRKGADASADASSALTKGGSLPWTRFLLLAAVAGLPTVLGAWLGAFASYSILPVIFFGLGAGAILVVLVQVGDAMRRDGPLLTPLNMVAFVAGYVVMLGTALLTA